MKNESISDTHSQVSDCLSEQKETKLFRDNYTLVTPPSAFAPSNVYTWELDNLSVIWPSLDLDEKYFKREKEQTQ